MPSAPNDLAPAGHRRRLRWIVVAAAVATSTFLPGAVATADDLDGTAVVGELVQAWPEAPAATAAGHEDEGPISWVETAAGEAVRIDTDDVEGIPPGSTVSVTVGSPTQGDGGTADDPAHDVLSHDVVALPPAAPVLADAAGLTNQVTVVLVAPAGAAPDGVTVQRLIDVVDGPVADFWSEQSNGAIKVGVTATRDWVSPVAGCTDPTAMWNEVATTVGFVPGPGKHLMLYVSGAATGCSYALAEVGSAPATGGRLYVRDTVPSVIAHELGHNLGLGHSSGRQCDAAMESGSCRTAAYRDHYDVMGVSWAQLGSLNAPQAARLGVLPAAQQQSLALGGSPATVILAPLSGSTGTRALRLTDADGVDYWLEYRTPTLQDSWLGTAANHYRLQAGVLLHRADGLPDTSVLLDGTPVPAGSWDGDFQAALPVGAPVPVSGGDFTVVVQETTTTGAVLSVTPAPVAPAAAPAARPAPAAPGGLMSGTGASPEAAAPPADDAAGFRVHAYGRAPVLRSTPALQAAADSSSGGGVVVAVVGAVLAASALLVLRATRRSWIRRS